MFTKIINNVQKTKDTLTVQVTEKTNNVKIAVTSTINDTNVKVNQAKVEIIQAKDNAKDEIIQAKDKAKVEVIQAKDKAIANISNVALQKIDNDALNVKNHFLEGIKYGMKGSNGTWSSNYYRHSLNNHPLLSLFFADKENPFDAKRRKMVFFCTYSLAFILSSIWIFYLNPETKNEDDIVVNDDKDNTSQLVAELIYAFVTSLIMTPVAYILNYAGTCTYCYKNNTCTGLAHSCGLIFLIMSTCFSVGFLIGGVVIVAVQKENKLDFLILFGMTLVLDFLQYFYFGIFNWLVYSWDGFCCFPQCNKDSKQFCGLLTRFPLNLVIGSVGLGASTYEDDKKEFQEKYPGYISIDKPPQAEPEFYLNSLV